MNHYMDFDPYLIRSRNEQMREEVNSLRLGERLHKNRNPRGSRLAALVEWCGLGSLVKRVRWGGTTAMVLAVVVALAALALVAPSSQAAGKPDLVVTEAQLTSRNYVFSGVESKFSFKATTKNTKNRGSATAGRSKTYLGFWRTLKGPGRLLANRDVPALKPGESDEGSGSDTRTLGRDRIGSYHVGVCADGNHRIDESDESNNCRNTGERLDIIPRRWTGTVEGSYAWQPGVTETWTGQATFKFDAHGDGSYAYKLSRADVSYNVSGTDALGCTWSGSGTATIVNGDGKLYVRDHFGTYDGYGRSPEPFYTMTWKCPSGATGTFDGPMALAWFYTGESSRKITNPVGVTELKGSYTTPDGRIFRKWDLMAKLRR